MKFIQRTGYSDPDLEGGEPLQIEWTPGGSHADSSFQSSVLFLTLAEN